MSYSIFISHCMADEDAPIVRALEERLRGRGIEPYLAERDPQPGEPLSSKVLQRIKDSDLVAVFWTRGGASSAWVNQELGVALSEGKRVVPIIERGVSPRGMLEGLERVEFDRAAPEKALGSLESFMARHREAKLQAEVDKEMRADLVILIVLTVTVIAALVIVLTLATREG